MCDVWCVIGNVYLIIFIGEILVPYVFIDSGRD